MKLRGLMLASAIATIGVLPFSAGPVQAGLAVTDTGAYVRIANNLNELRRQTEVLTDQFNELQNIFGTLKGNLGAGQGVIRDVQRARRRAEGLTKSIHNIPGRMDLDDYDLNKIEDLQKVMGNVFNKELDIVTRGLSRKQIEGIRQRSVKSAIEQSEQILGNMDNSNNKIDELARQIDATDDMKEAADMTNRLLIEVIFIQQQQLQLLASLARAEQYANYEGIDSTNPDADNEPEDTAGDVTGGKKKRWDFRSVHKRMQEKTGGIDCLTLCTTGDKDACKRAQNGEC